jgi:ribosomal protein S18 acetylase RimI-like enzyme
MLARMDAIEPSLVRVRSAVVTDAAAVARIDVETWRDTYAGVLPQQMLVGLSTPQRRRAWSQFILRCPGDLMVATHARDGVVAFGSCGTRRGGISPYAGEVFTLYVEPAYQGEGIGRRVLLHLFGRLLRRSLASAQVWVLRDNPSRFFYERLGGKLVAHKPVRIDRIDVDVEAVAYGWSDLAAVLEAQSRAGR